MEFRWKIEIVIYILQHMNRDQIKLQSHLEGKTECR